MTIWYSLADFKKKSFFELIVDSWPKLLLFRTHHSWNSTTELILLHTPGPWRNTIYHKQGVPRAANKMSRFDHKNAIFFFLGRLSFVSLFLHLVLSDLIHKSVRMCSKNVKFYYEKKTKHVCKQCFAKIIVHSLFILTHLLTYLKAKFFW